VASVFALFEQVNLKMSRLIRKISVKHFSINKHEKARSGDISYNAQATFNRNLRPLTYLVPIKNEDSANLMGSYVPTPPPKPKYPL
jgi:hypothetical protein